MLGKKIRTQLAVFLFLALTVLLYVPAMAQEIAAFPVLETVPGSDVRPLIRVENSVSYNGLKHVPLLILGGQPQTDLPVKKGCIRDLRISVSSDALDFATVTYRARNNRNAVYKTDKRPCVILRFRAKKGATAEQKKYLRTLNKALRNDPVYFNIAPRDISSLELELKRKNGAVRSIKTVIDGNPVKLTSGDFDQTGSAEDVIITGRNNFTGVWPASANSKEEEKKKEEEEKKETDNKDVATDEGIRKILTGLSFDILSTSSVAESIKDGKNLAVSAYSIDNAFGMMASGAKGDTLKELEDTLFYGSSIEDFNREIAGYNAHVASLNGEGFSTDLANGIWVNGRDVDSGFREIVTDSYNAGISTEPFGDSTLGEINGFVAKHTKDMIKKILDSVEPEDRMILVNALYLEGVWEQDFDDEHVIEDQDFTDSKGGKRKAVMLSDEENSLYFSYKGADGVIKDLKDGKGKFVAILPPGDESLTDFMAKCNSDTMACIEAGIDSSAELTTRFPEFEYEYETSLAKVLSEMGVNKAFGSGADFSGIFEDEQIYIDSAVHKTRVKVDRKGAKAAAATAIVAKATSVMQPKPRKVVIFDRPFLYMLTDENYVPLFVGVVNSAGE